MDVCFAVPNTVWSHLLDDVVRVGESTQSPLTKTSIGFALNRKSILWPTTRGRDVSKRILMEFTIVSNEIQYFVTRNSKLAGLRRSACQWINWHRKTTPAAHPLRSMTDIRKPGKSHSTNRAKMHR